MLTAGLLSLAYLYIGIAHMLTDLSVPAVHSKAWLHKGKRGSFLVPVLLWPTAEVFDFQHRYGRSARSTWMALISAIVDVSILFLLLSVSFYFAEKIAHNLAMRIIISVVYLFFGYFIVRPISSVVSALVFGVCYGVFNKFIPYKKISSF